MCLIDYDVFHNFFSFMLGTFLYGIRLKYLYQCNQTISKISLLIVLMWMWIAVWNMVAWNPALRPLCARILILVRPLSINQVVRSSSATQVIPMNSVVGTYHWINVLQFLDVREQIYPSVSPYISVNLISILTLVKMFSVMH